MYINFRILQKKLIGYKGQFVIITDVCYGGNIYRGGLKNYPEHLKRFTLLCGEDPYYMGWGIGWYQWYSSRLIEALSEYNDWNNLKVDIQYTFKQKPLSEIKRRPSLWNEEHILHSISVGTFEKLVILYKINKTEKLSENNW